MTPDELDRAPDHFVEMPVVVRQVALAVETGWFTL